MHDTLAMHEADGGDELAHDVAGLGLGEALLTSNATQQLAALQQLQDQVSVQL